MESRHRRRENVTMHSVFANLLAKPVIIKMKQNRPVVKHAVQECTLIYLGKVHVKLVQWELIKMKFQWQDVSFACLVNIKMKIKQRQVAKIAKLDSTNKQVRKAVAAQCL